MSIRRSEIYVHAVVEGMVDEILVRRLFSFIDETVNLDFYGKNGKNAIKHNINKYNQAAKFSNWFVLVDLDQDGDCAPALRNNWLSNSSQYMLFRIAVREIESWLLADRERISRFLGVAETKIPSHLEKLMDPKKEMVNLARASKYRGIRIDMAPREGSGLLIGPAYNARLIEFITDEQRGWRPEIAAQNSESLKKCLEGLKNRKGKWKVL